MRKIEICSRSFRSREKSLKRGRGGAATIAVLRQPLREHFDDEALEVLDQPLGLRHEPALVEDS